MSKQAVADVAQKKNFKELMEDYVGDQIVIIAARYQYWGLLSCVTEDAIVLSQASAVERSGPAQSDAPQTIDVIGGSIIIKNDAIELMYQPKWYNNPLPGTE